MFFKCVLTIARLSFALVKGVLCFLLLKAIEIILYLICTPNHAEQDQELPTPNPDTAKQIGHQSVESQVQSKQRHSVERSRLSSTGNNTKSEPRGSSEIPDSEDRKAQFQGVQTEQKSVQRKDQSLCTGRSRLSSVDSNTKIEPQGYLASESKQPHSAKRPTLHSVDGDMKIEPEGSETKQPHSIERQRLSSTGSDIKSDPDGYLASESSESPESEDIKTRKTSNKERHMARPLGSDSCDSNEEQIISPPVPHTASESATLVDLPITQPQVGLKCNIHLFSDNENESSSDGDYIQPHQEQNPQACNYPTGHMHMISETEGDLCIKMKKLKDELESEKRNGQEKDQIIEQQKASIEELKKKLIAAKRGRVSTHLVNIKSYCKGKRLIQRIKSKYKRNLSHKD